MKLALNGATTMHADLETDIAAAAAAGFDCIEIWAAKLRVFLQNNSADDLKKLLQDNNLQPWSINSIEHITFRSDEDYTKIKAECEEYCAIAAQIHCPYVVVVPGKLPENATPELISAASVKVLNELADIADKHETNAKAIGLAFEFLGQSDCSVQTLEACHEIVDAVNRPNVGLVLDSFHFYAGGSDIETIGKLNPDKLFVFHINDAEDLPKAELTDAHRLLPGYGILPVEAIARQLDNIGYDRVASVEIFRPEYWERDPFELAKEAYAASLKVLSSEVEV